MISLRKVIIRQLLISVMKEIEIKERIKFHNPASGS